MFCFLQSVHSYNRPLPKHGLHFSKRIQVVVGCCTKVGRGGRGGKRRTRQKERDEAKRSHQKKEEKFQRNKPEAEQPSGRRNGKWEGGGGQKTKRIVPLTGGDGSAPRPRVQRSCANPAGRRMLPGAKGRSRKPKKKRRQGEDSAAPNVIMQWAGSANGRAGRSGAGQDGMVVFCIFLSL